MNELSEENRLIDESSVLIVDDDETFSAVLARALTKRGYTTFVAHSIAEACRLAEKHNPNLAIIDLNMNMESGLTLLTKLKNINPSIKMLILTGYSSIATAVEAIKLGAVNYLCKPADADEILSAFENQTGNSTVEISINPLSVDRLEWEHIQKILKAHDGNVSATAKSLGMHRRTLQRKLQKRPVKK